MTEITDPLVLATIALFAATGVLAAFTGMLWRTNKALAAAEERRSAVDARRRRYARVAWKVELAERILKEDRTRFLPTVDKSSDRGGWYRAERNAVPTGAPWLRHFARLVDPRDGISADTLNALLVVLDSMSREGTSIAEDDMEAKFFTPLKRLQENIHSGPKGEGEKHSLLRKWRSEMDELAAGEEVPPTLA